MNKLLLNEFKAKRVNNAISQRLNIGNNGVIQKGAGEVWSAAGHTIHYARGNIMKDMVTAAKLLCGTVLMAGAFGAQAADVDLTTAGSSGTINGATYTQAMVQPGGTGVLGSFVRLLRTGTEQGFNTTEDGTFDNIGGDPNNHEITVGQIGFIDVNGTDPGGEVMRFILDINETNGELTSLLSLVELQIFLSSTPNQDEPAAGAPADGALLALDDAFLVYQMDAGGDSTVFLDADLSSGSGQTDMFLDIPLTMFTAAFAAGGFDTLTEQNNAFIYLYSRFTGAESGFEEWAARRGAPLGEPPCVVNCGEQEVPEPGALGLFAIGLAGAAVVMRRRRRS